LAGAEKLAKYVKETLGKEVKVCNKIEDCVVDADVIVTATFASEPVLGEVTMKPWVHINCI